MSAILWEPSESLRRSCAMTAFMAEAERRFDVPVADYDSLWRWSVGRPEQFWDLVWDFCGVVAEAKGDTVVEDLERMPGARWFPGARLNFAENLLRRRDDADALVYRAEDRVAWRWSHRTLYDTVARIRAALEAEGVKAGDRVAGYLPNMPHTVAAMLAAASLGAVWTSASPDFGVQGVLDRFGQVEPRVLIAAEGYVYNGKDQDCLGRLVDIAAALPSVSRVVVVPHIRNVPDLSDIRNAVAWEEWLAPHAAGEIDFRPLPFDHPLYIMYSSGTTGAPKCIVHGAGGTLLQHLKEHRLHSDIRIDDRVFYFTTCGWMMWNWLVSGLAAGATLMLYDGSPFAPSGEVLFDYARDERFTFFGTSAKYLEALANHGIAPAGTHDLSALRTIASTGSPLAPEGFDHVYGKVKADVQLASIAGGTDIVSCFVLGVPLRPVRRGEIQGRGLGMAVMVYDDRGRPVYGRKGELVCVQAFPSMPIGFWNDPDGARYHKAYFATYENVWHHGDFVELTISDGVVIHGRSDATLNPGGVRIGTAEIYRVVEQLPEVTESLVVGQDWDNDMRVVLFVHLARDSSLDEALEKRIKTAIRQGCSPRHVPARIVPVTAIPRTKSGKIVELAVRDVVHGRPVRNKEALANPEALDQYADRPELAE